MKFTIDTSKIAEAVSDLGQRTSDKGRKAIADVQAGAAALTEKTKQENYLRRLKKYNPLFPDAYSSSEFVLPKMIMLREEVERRGIDVCEGAIGWLGKESEMEVLYLYDKAVPSSGLQFVPVASSGAVYFADGFDPKRFIRTDCIFSRAHEERLAELKYVAHSLGAKSCTIEIYYGNHDVKKEGIIWSWCQSPRCESFFHRKCRAECFCQKLNSEKWKSICRI